MRARQEVRVGRAGRIGLVATLWLAGCGGFGDGTLVEPDVVPTWEGEVEDLLAEHCTRCHVNRMVSDR